jgi:hypothetical protein
MEFRIDCPCGEHLMIGEGAAGATFTCACGKPIVVPSLTKLRVSAGLPANDVAPEQIVEHLLFTGEVPGPPTCIACDQPTDRVMHVVAECERVQKPAPPKLSWWVLLFVSPLAFSIARLMHRDTDPPPEHGRDKIYPLPLRICPRCEPMLSDPAHRQRCLRMIPEYRLLLDKFPGAMLSVGA